MSPHLLTPARPGSARHRGRPGAGETWRDLPDLRVRRELARSGLSWPGHPGRARPSLAAGKYGGHAGPGGAAGGAA